MNDLIVKWDEFSQKLINRVTTLQAENANLKQLLRDAKLPYSLAIYATPSGPKRNKLTEMNLLRLDALKE